MNVDTQQEEYRLDLYEGKYTVIQKQGSVKALRYGEPWRELTGDNLIFFMLEELKEAKATAEQERARWVAAVKELDKEAVKQGNEQVEWSGNPYNLVSKFLNDLAVKMEATQ